MLLLCCYKHFTPLFFLLFNTQLLLWIKKTRFHLLEIEHEGEIQKASKILLFPLIG